MSCESGAYPHNLIIDNFSSPSIRGTGSGWLKRRMKEGATSIRNTAPRVSEQQQVRISSHEAIHLSLVSNIPTDWKGDFTREEIETSIASVQAMMRRILGQGEGLIGPIVQDSRKLQDYLKKNMQHEIEITEDPFRRLRKKGMYRVIYAQYLSQMRGEGVKVVPHPFLVSNTKDVASFDSRKILVKNYEFEMIMDEVIDEALNSSHLISEDGFTIDNNDMFIDSVYQVWTTRMKEKRSTNSDSNRRFTEWITQYRKNPMLTKREPIFGKIASAFPSNWRATRAAGYAIERKIKVEDELELDAVDYAHSIRKAVHKLSKHFSEEACNILTQKLESIAEHCNAHGIDLNKNNVREIWNERLSSSSHIPEDINDAFEAWYNGTKMSRWRLNKSTYRIKSGLVDAFFMKKLGAEIHAASELAGVNNSSGSSSRIIESISNELEGFYRIDPLMQDRMRNDPDLISNLARSIAKSIPFYAQRSYTGWPIYIGFWGAIEENPVLNNLVNTHPDKAYVLATVFALSMSAWKAVSQKIRFERDKASPDGLAALGYTLSVLDNPSSHRHPKVAAVSGFVTDNALWGFTPASLIVVSRLGPASTTGFIASLGCNYLLEKGILRYPDFAPVIRRELGIIPKHKNPITMPIDFSHGGEYVLGDGVHFEERKS